MIYLTILFKVAAARKKKRTVFNIRGVHCSWKWMSNTAMVTQSWLWWMRIYRVTMEQRNYLLFFHLNVNHCNIHNLIISRNWYSFIFVLIYIVEDSHHYCCEGITTVLLSRLLRDCHSDITRLYEMICCFTNVAVAAEFTNITRCFMCFQTITQTVQNTRHISHLQYKAMQNF